MAAAIIPGADVSIKTLQIIVEGIIGVDRKIAIAFTNLTDINSKDAVLFSAHKLDHTARGTVGTFSYYIPIMLSKFHWKPYAGLHPITAWQNEDKTVHVMWSVPFDYNLYSNWWNVAVVDGCQSPDSNVHENLYNGSRRMPYPNKPDKSISNESNSFWVLGYMSNDGQATLYMKLVATNYIPTSSCLELSY
uniref:Uncharacterized protein n=1 Tax=Physcomitrium patens TaxID=3218 RepID=A0A2K1IEK6_PHYPA|nr:hypothetical protein PHYPA_029860 [Physcomitrium patens]